ncbi:hypothetical protein PAN31117_01836 [Pandoraea anapnoica]|uniref:Uncharacterized protein n=1 Tax=Pandoraea anapnoica TaxID=2508301 RepID=A0A5E4ZWZ7_9BURK|nr:hypothetical protein [Pandoraea anapnoica]VVE65338.1 hypothetical protein PAN31117_01836 [Pandoraea anapnoica]
MTKFGGVDGIVKVKHNRGLPTRITLPMFRTSALAFLLCVASFAGNSSNALAIDQSEKHSGPAVMVHFDYYRTDYATLRKLEARLGEAIRRAMVGELSESELHLDGNDGYLYMYGPDPDRLYDVARPILRANRLTANAEVTKWRGTHTETVLLSPGKADLPSSGAKIGP